MARITVTYMDGLFEIFEHEALQMDLADNILRIGVISTDTEDGWTVGIPIANIYRYHFKDGV